MKIRYCWISRSRWLNAAVNAIVLLLLAAASANAAEPWWKNAVIYEIYPRSFADTNGDGIGDLNGITAHLDYLKNLGVDAIWIAPFYPSPLVDFGYDVADYLNVAPEYGTLADFDRLASEAKKRNIHVLIDLVVNHSSNQNKWFLESKSSRTNPKADWYVWHDAKPGGGPPNNWGGRNGSSWEWVPERQQYYYHHYAIEQPDLNWRNPEVREAVFNVMRFWLKRGAYGFRLDGISNLYEDAELRDERHPKAAVGHKGLRARREGRAAGEASARPTCLKPSPHSRCCARWRTSFPIPSSWHSCRPQVQPTWLKHTARIATLFNCPSTRHSDAPKSWTQRLSGRG